MGMLLTRHYADNNKKSEVKGVAETVAPKPSVSISEKSTEPKPKSEPEFSKEQINAMNGTALRKLAEKNGVENPEELTAKELKAVLCDLLVK